MQKSILKIHSQQSLSLQPRHTFLFLSLLLQFFFLFFIFPLSEKLRAASQSRKKEVGLTPLAKVIEKWLEQQANNYLQLLFIYLFRRYRVPGLRKERKKKQYSFFHFLMGLPSTDNVPVLFPFSWIFSCNKVCWECKVLLSFLQPEKNKTVLY